MKLENIKSLIVRSKEPNGYQTTFNEVVSLEDIDGKYIIRYVSTATNDLRMDTFDKNGFDIFIKYSSNCIHTGQISAIKNYLNAIEKLEKVKDKHITINWLFPTEYQKGYRKGWAECVEDIVKTVKNILNEGEKNGGTNEKII